MIDPYLVGFVGYATVLAMLPGADTALVTRNALAIGRRRTMVTILGICTGCIIHALASALGLSAILATSARAFDIVKTVGAVYLIWIGIQSIRDAGKAQTAPPSTGVRSIASNPFLQGFLTNLLNPKVAIFYLTFLPQFIPPGSNVLQRSLFLATLHNVIGFVWLSSYAWFIDQIGGVLTRPAVKAWLERVTGGLLVALGLRLAWERR